MAYWQDSDDDGRYGPEDGRTGADAWTLPGDPDDVNMGDVWAIFDRYRGVERQIRPWAEARALAGQGRVPAAGAVPMTVSW